MRKNFFPFLSLLFLIALVGCGSNELNDFTSEYNKIAEYEGLPKIDSDRFSDIEEEDDGFKWRNLFESDRYYIDADYGYGNEIIGYTIAIDPSEPFVDQEGQGYRASVTIANALGLSPREYAKNFREALKTNQHSYTEGDYEISFIYIGWDSSIDTSIYVSFYKSNTETNEREAHLKLQDDNGETNEKKELDNAVTENDEESDEEFEQDVMENFALMTLQENFQEIGEVEFDKGNKSFKFLITDPDFTAELMFLVEYDMEDEWYDLVDSFVLMSDSMNDILGDGYTLYLLNPLNEEKSLLSIMDGIVNYDILGE